MHKYIAKYEIGQIVSFLNNEVEIHNIIFRWNGIVSYDVKIKNTYLSISDILEQYVIGEEKNIDYSYLMPFDTEKYDYYVLLQKSIISNCYITKIKIYRCSNNSLQSTYQLRIDRINILLDWVSSKDIFTNLNLAQLELRTDKFNELLI